MNLLFSLIKPLIIKTVNVSLTSKTHETIANCDGELFAN